MTCAACHPTQPERIWAGAAGGGVWQSTDAGQTWQALWHHQDVLTVGALAIDPQDPQILKKSRVVIPAKAGIQQSRTIRDNAPGCPPELVLS